MIASMQTIRATLGFFVPINLVISGLAKVLSGKKMQTQANKATKVNKIIAKPLYWLNFRNAT
jgi:hypothetical protein